MADQFLAYLGLPFTLIRSPGPADLRRRLQLGPVPPIVPSGAFAWAVGMEGGMSVVGLRRLLSESVEMWREGGLWECLQGPDFSVPAQRCPHKRGQC